MFPIAGQLPIASQASGASKAKCHVLWFLSIYLSILQPFFFPQCCSSLGFIFKRSKRGLNPGAFVSCSFRSEPLAIVAVLTSCYSHQLKCHLPQEAETVSVYSPHSLGSQNRTGHSPRFSSPLCLPPHIYVPQRSSLIGLTHHGVPSTTTNSSELVGSTCC